MNWVALGWASMVLVLPLAALLGWLERRYRAETYRRHPEASNTDSSPESPE